MAKSGTPITLKLYGEVDGIQDELVKEFQRSIIPWGILKRAVRFARNIDMEKLDVNSLTEEAVDEMAGIVAAVFKDQVTVQELDAMADAGDMLNVIVEIMARASSIGNPTPPGR